MEFESYIVYARADDAGRVTEIASSAFLKSADGWVAIDSGCGDRYHHAQGNYLPLPLKDERGICRYRLEDGAVAERSAEEMDADDAARPAPEMTDIELLLSMAADHEYRLCMMELGVSGE